MNYSEFVEKVKEKIVKLSANKYDVCLKEVIKNNGVPHMGLSLLPKGRAGKGFVTGIAYLEPLYEDFEPGNDLNTIAEKLYGTLTGTSFPELKTECLSKFSEIKDNIIFELVNYELNKEVLTTRPFIKFMDLAITFSFIALNTANECGTVRINNDFLKEYNISEVELWEFAKHNTPKLLKANILSMSEVLCIEEADEATQNMYVICNEKKFGGASAMLYDDVLEEVALKFNSDLYILPSSVHEVIAISALNYEQKSALEDMVNNVNKTALSSEEILSDRVYYYDRLEKCLKIA